MLTAVKVILIVMLAFSLLMVVLGFATANEKGYSEKTDISRLHTALTTALFFVGASICAVGLVVCYTVKKEN